MISRVELIAVSSGVVKVLPLNTIERGSRAGVGSGAESPPPPQEYKDPSKIILMIFFMFT